MSIRSILQVTSVAFAIVAWLAASAVAQTAPASCPMDKTSRKYKLSIESVPPGATVYLGTKECGAVGQTPWTGKLAAGNVVIVLEQAGYEPATKVFKVAKTTKVQEVFVPLIKRDDPPRLDIRADADKNAMDAIVTVDGMSQGRIPVVVTTTPGRHLVELAKEGFETQSQWVEVKASEKVTMAPVMKQAGGKTGTVVVEADVPGAEVYIDGNKHPDVTPTAVSNVIEGLHVVEVRKEPAMPWKQTVQVIAGQQVKVRGELMSTMGGLGGTIRVLTNVPGAKVYLDGAEKGEAPMDLKDVKPGEHVVEVRADGYETREERVAINAGQSAVYKLDLQPGGSASDGVLRVASPVPNAEVYVDGALVGKVPQTKRVAPGEHFVTVKLPGYKDFEKRLTVTSGQTIDVLAEIKAAGRVLVLSSPAGARVLINGVDAGVTPLEADVEAGAAIVRIEQDGFESYEQTIAVESGSKATVTTELQVAARSAAESAYEQRSLSHFGARTLPRNRATADFGVGFPWYLEGRLNVGVGKVKNFGLDAGIGARTLGTRTEIGFGARLQLLDHSPFALGAFTDLWMGSTVFDNSARNGVSWNVGGIASLTAMRHATVSLRAYFQTWSDRHCPTVDSTGEFDGEPTRECQVAYQRRFTNQTPNDVSEATVQRMEELVGEGAALFERESGARLMLSLIGEIALRQQWNGFFILETAPGQDERALFTNVFTKTMPSRDPGMYFRAGLTYKF